VSAPGATAGRFVGQSVVRREDPRLLTGQGNYVDDLQLAGTLHAAFVRSHVARGRIVSIDTDEARAVPGVVAVFTGADLNPRALQMWHTMLGPPPELGGVTTYPPSRPLAGDDVRFVGDPIALVVAVDRYVAEDAAELVVVDIDPMPAILDIRAAAADAANLVHPELGSNIAAEMPAPVAPPVEQMIADAAHVVTRTFRQARATNVPMEPRGIVVQFSPHGDLQIWASTQSTHEWRSFASRLTGVPEPRVRAMANDVGGGFGQKMMVSRDEASVMLAAVALGGPPLKWVEDRRENLIAANQAREEEIDVTMAVDAEGHIVAAKVHFWEDCGSYAVHANGSAAGQSVLMFPGPYKMPVVLPAVTAVYTNTCGRAAYRGPWMMETVAREQMMDHVAREIGIDPIEFRRRNIIHAEDLPYTTSTTAVYESITPAETLDQALGMLGIDAFRAEQSAARAQGRLIGVGVSVYIEPSAIAFGILSSDSATLRIDPSGKVVVAMGTGSHGHSLETTIPQVIAEHLGCDIDDVVLVQGDTSATPVGPGTGGSRSAVIAGGAAQTAALRLRDKVFEIAAHLLEAAPADLEVAGSVVSVKGTPTRAVPFVQLASVAYLMPDMLPPDVEPGLEVTARYRPPTPFTWSNATHVCTVEVDRATGEVEILRYIVSEDCGRMINPMVVEGQIAGGVAQGIGGALFEHMIYDGDGNPLATTFLDYLLPSAPELPDFEYGHIETLSGSIGGYKGMGEGGAIGSPPAVANAVHDALAHLGVHPTDFPLGPSQVRALIRAAEQPSGPQQSQQQ
jgi:carbon-monoxide dehydrogenase large subunit